MVKATIHTAVFLVCAAAAARAGVLFDNFPVKGTIDAWTINNGFAVSNSFTLTAAATVNGAAVGIWEQRTDPMTAVNWWIGVKPFSPDHSGNSQVASRTLLFNNTDFGLDIDVVTFYIPDLTLGAGTYYLGLGNALSNSLVYWDENDGAGVDAWENSLGRLSNGGACQTPGTGTCAESFQILGIVNTSAVPEPATGVLFGSAVLIAAAVRRFRKK
jgi:hypothetical protein